MSTSAQKMNNTCLSSRKEYRIYGLGRGAKLHSHVLASCRICGPKPIWTPADVNSPERQVTSSS